KHGIEPVFWKAFNSRVERAVMGAIAQDGMELARDRMAAGTRQKAMSGRVTAHRPAYGFKLVDSKGVEGPAAKKDSHYAIYEEQAVWVRFIFTSIGIHGKSLRSTANELKSKIPPPRGKFWRMATLAKMIKNPVYKGQFVAHRFDCITV